MNDNAVGCAVYSAFLLVFLHIAWIAHFNSRVDHAESARLIAQIANVEERSVLIEERTNDRWILGQHTDVIYTVRFAPEGAITMFRCTKGLFQKQVCRPYSD